MLKLVLPCTALSLTILLAGCTITSTPTSHQQLCDMLKRQYVYNTTNINVETHDTTPQQKAALLSQIRANNCE